MEDTSSEEFINQIAPLTWDQAVIPTTQEILQRISTPGSEIGDFITADSYFKDTGDTRGIANVGTLKGTAFDLAFWAGATFVNRLGAPFQVYASGLITISSPAGSSRIIQGGTTASTGLSSATRWQIFLGDSTAETGSDAGSNFKILGQSDSVPSNFFVPILIERKTGNTVFSAFGSVLPHAKSLVEFQSTTKGVRFPNMTTAQRDAITPGAGTVIYNTSTAKLNVYTTGWEAITSA